MDCSQHLSLELLWPLEAVCLCCTKASWGQMRAQPPAKHVICDRASAVLPLL